MQYARINTFGGLNVTEDSTNAPTNSLAVAENVLVRPAGAIRRAPAFSKLWNMSNLRGYVFDNLGFGPGAGVLILEVKVNSNNADMVVLVAYDCNTEKTLGCFFVGTSDGRVPLTSELGGIQKPAATPSWTSNVLTNSYPVQVNDLISGLASGKRVYFSRIYDEVWIGNGVNPNLIYTPSTGAIREAGTNTTPDAPFAGTTASLPASAAVQATASVITAGTSVTVGTSTTIGTSTLTFTADSINFSGAAGNNIAVRIISSGISQAISSTRTGAGTTLSPFVYTLTLGTTAAQSSGNAIASFVASDYNATGVLTAAVSSPATEPNPSLTLAQTNLSGGVDGSPSGGHPTTMRCVFACTLFDPGPAGKGLGYEGPISASSAEVAGTGSNDFLVTVKAKSDEPRFTKQNIWMIQYAGPVYPISPDGPFIWRKVLTVNNANATHRIKKDFETLETLSAAPKQGRIPASTMFEFVGDKMWASGNAAEPYRVWISKTATDTERVPEGCDITSYIDVEGKKEEPSRPRVTALRKLEGRVQVHTDRSITMVEADSLRRIVSRSDYGAINPSCLAAWNRPNIPYLGSDGVLYSLNNTQYYRSGEVATTGWPKMRLSADVTTLYSNPQRANMLADATSNIVLVWLPTTGAVNYSAFAFDFTSNALTGPIHWPKLLSCSPVSAADSRYVGCDESGDLFVLDLGFLHNDEFSSNSAFTVRANDTTLTTRQSGLPQYFFDDGTWILSGFKCAFETQWLDLQQPNNRKGFYSLEWTTVRHSRAIVKVILTSDDGHSKTFDCGEMYGRDRNKIAFMISGNAIKVRFEAIVGEDKPFIVRDLTIGYELQTNAGGFFF
jgi:hypothetical protein